MRRAAPGRGAPASRRACRSARCRRRRSAARSRDRAGSGWSTSVAELVRVGLAALAEAGAELVRLVGLEIGAQQQVVGQARQATDAAVAGVERGLDRGQREGAAL